jgi:C4-dicarboxylate-specific signal transduction histidine kinase
MDIYKRKSYWNIALAFFGLLILIITMVYSNFLAQKLKEREEENVKVYVQAVKEQLEFQNQLEHQIKVQSGLEYQLNQLETEKESIKDSIKALVLSSSILNQDVGVVSEIIQGNRMPVIWEDEIGRLDGYNLGAELDQNEEYLKTQKNKFIKSGKNPLIGSGSISKVYYFNTSLVSYINYFPYIQLLLVGSFILLGYFFLVGSKRSEQNRVWAGMAKETAHQLGTPISAIIGWIEHLKLTDPSEEQLEIVEELRSDVNRLELVADRFSKIGAEPVLTKINIYNEMDECKQYMERRAPRKVSFNYPHPTEGSLFVNINKHLFDWVIENLIRNSLDAMDGKGELSATIYEDGDYINIDMTDTGKGIPSGKQSTIFRPGFTTKQRGWGLGLSLAKRIIENYHSGKIFVKNSKPGVGTTFTVRLPKA